MKNISKVCSVAIIAIFTIVVLMGGVTTIAFSSKSSTISVADSEKQLAKAIEAKKVADKKFAKAKAAFEAVTKKAKASVDKNGKMPKSEVDKITAAQIAMLKANVAANNAERALSVAKAKVAAAKAAAAAAAAAPKEKMYTSPDSKWKTPMYSMDAVINGKRQLWAMNSKIYTSDLWGTGKASGMVWVSLDINHYAPLEFSFVGPSFTISIEESAKEGVTYTKDDFGYMGYEARDGQVVNLTKSGSFNLYSNAKRNYISSAETSSTSYVKETRDQFTEAVLRLDKLDREKGIAIGYIKFKTVEKSGNRLEVEGYFAENFKDTAAHPTNSDVYRKLHPEDPKNANSNNSKGNTNVNKNTKLPSFQYISCPVCGGSGKTICNICHGVGYSQSMGYQYGQYGLIIKTCIYCSGGGGHICSRCGGTGSVTSIK